MLALLVSYKMIIRKFRNKDADAVSELIVDNLRTVNIRDYSAELMDALAEYKTPQQVLIAAAECDAFVAVENEAILGVAMLDEDQLANVFTHTRMHGKGIGRSLLDHIETRAREQNISVLKVDSSITALGFYIRCGYQVIRKAHEQFCGIENTVFEMSKSLDAPESGGT